MKIAFVYDMIYPFHVGGAELRNYMLAKCLRARGHEVHLFGVKLWDGPDVIEYEGLILHGVCRYQELYNFRGKRKIWEPISFAFKLFRPLREEKFDVIDTSNFFYFHCWTCWLVSFIQKTPLVITWHQYWNRFWFRYLGPVKGFCGKLVEDSIRGLTKHHIAVSQTTKKDLKNSGLAEKNIFVSYNGVDFSDIDAAIPPQKKDFDILFAGRLIEEKNVSLLIHAVKLLVKDLPDLKIALIGKGPQETELKNLVQQLQLERHFIFMGNKKDIKEVYAVMKRSKLFVLPSILEGFGIVVVEAQACGLPVIVVESPWNAATELVDEDLIVKNDAQALAEKIKILLKDETRRQAYGKAAFEHAKNFNWTFIVEELEKYYRSIIKDNL